MTNRYLVFALALVLCSIGAALVSMRSVDQGQSDSDKSLDSLKVAYNAQRDSLLKEAKRLFVENKPDGAVSLLRPFESVADGEVLAVYKLALAQKNGSLTEVVEPIHPAPDEESEDEEKEECRLDLRCWANTNYVEAMSACRAKMSERLEIVKVNGTGRNRWFDRFERGPSSSTAVVWFGSIARIPDSTAASGWQMADYWCEYEADTKSVISYDVVGNGKEWKGF